MSKETAYVAYQYDEFAGQGRVDRRQAPCVGPRADVLNRLVFECAPSAKNDTEVWEAFPRFFQGVMHLRSVGNVAGIPGRGVVPEL
jgi:hypothetical protein